MSCSTGKDMRCAGAPIEEIEAAHKRAAPPSVSVRQGRGSGCSSRSGPNSAGGAFPAGGRSGMEVRERFTERENQARGGTITQQTDLGTGKRCVAVEWRDTEEATDYLNADSGEGGVVDDGRT